MTRVLQIVTTMNRGGLETMLMNYYRRVDRELVQFDFLEHRAAESDYDAEIKELGGRIYRLPALNPISPSYLKALNCFFKEHKDYRVVHSHLDCMSAIPLGAAKKAGVPVRIAHAHSSSQDRNLKFPVKIICRMRIPLSATRLLACGDTAGGWMFCGAPFEVLPNAIDTERFAFSETERALKREELAIGDRLAVLHIGRFYWPKNHEFLLRIFAGIMKIRPDVVLLLAGEGELLEATKSLAAKYNISDNVIFLGLRTDIPDLLSASDVMVFPSRYEGLGISVIEAQASGLPCLVSDRVPGEAALTGLVSSMSLDESPEKWAEKAVEMSSVPRKSGADDVRAAGYDIQSAAKMLQSFYLRAGTGEEDAKLWQR
ncbi:MAG: glycosyltransferase family 1 protein [Clostridia bacterium]|nr:glycosyltransferase family 1 protein [Clostridia bacterium]